MKRILIIMLAGVALMTSCSRNFITDKAFMDVVSEDFASRSEILASAGVNLDAMGLDEAERQAMEFLYAYMPLGDIVNMSPEYYLKHYHLTMEALAEMPWGKNIPEREMRHFVLPVRVNNENLDESRTVFFAELAPRVKDLSMYDAVLEVNHWCHEKAIYMPSDRRTSSPLATVKTAYGRCGEESTLLVAALRSVGIPSRQVYTPRWAHTDSNHAWVEAWVDGEWYFLGACEPEPVLDLGWFNAPASRGMLMHTNVFGKYDGPEDVVRRTPNYTEINVIENYAPESAPLQVKVVDSEGRPVEGAKVEFKIYNYSNFDTVATKDSDAEGLSSLTAGLGDMLIHASKDGRFGFAKVTYGKDAEVVIALEHEEGAEIAHLELEVVPPVENAQLPEVTPEQRAENTCRMEYEDSLRNAYVGTFYDKARAEAFASANGLDPERTAAVLVASRGNHAEIAAFLVEAVKNGKGARALDLLRSVSEKDLRDTPESVLADFLQYLGLCHHVCIGHLGVIDFLHQVAQFLYLSPFFLYCSGCRYGAKYLGHLVLCGHSIVGSGIGIAVFYAECRILLIQSGQSGHLASQSAINGLFSQRIVKFATVCHAERANPGLVGSLASGGRNTDVQGSVLTYECYYGMLVQTVAKSIGQSAAVCGQITDGVTLNIGYGLVLVCVCRGGIGRLHAFNQGGSVDLVLSCIDK